MKATHGQDTARCSVQASSLTLASTCEMSPFYKENMAQRNQLLGLRSSLCPMLGLKLGLGEPFWSGPKCSDALTILCILEACSQAVLFIQTGVFLLLLALSSPVCWPLDGTLPWGALGSRTTRHCAQPTAGAPTASVLPPSPPTLQAGGSWRG